MTDNDTQTTSSSEPGRSAHWERDLLEKLAFASLNEQRKARRWGIFFKLFFAVYLVAILFLSVRRLQR